MVEKTGKHAPLSCEPFRGTAKGMGRKLKDFGASGKFLIKPTLILVVMYLVAYSAIILANFNYIDDIGRAAEGYQYWDNYSRFLSNFFSQFIHADAYLADISPLTQIIAIFELAFSGVLALYIVTEKKIYSLWMLIATLPLGLSPYFLECISYKFDSPYMGLSILASIAPLVLMNCNRIAYFVAVAVGELVVCTTYQAASGILPMFVLFVACYRWNKGDKAKNVAIFVGLSAVAWTAGILIFRLFIMVPVHSHVSNSVPDLAGLIPLTIAHFTTYMEYVLTEFKMLWLVLCGLVMVLFVVMIGFNSARGEIWGVISTLLCLALMTGMIFGLYPILEVPQFAPRAMYGIGAYLAFLAIGIVVSEHALIGRIVVAVLCWCFLVFSFAYGNALSVQDDWEDFYTDYVVEELSSLPEFQANSERFVQLEGNIGHAPALKKVIDNTPILDRLIPITFGDGWKWGVANIFLYYDLPNTAIAYSGDLSKDDLSLLRQNTYFDIYGEDGDFLVVFK